MLRKMKKFLLILLLIPFLGFSQTDNINEFYKQTEVGKTTYDLMTNGSMYRRFLSYPDGKMSFTWSYSSSERANNYTDRGSNFVHFDGTSWSQQLSQRVEPSRAGFPNIITVKEGGVEKEVIISHLAVAAASTLSGGLIMMKNSAVGNSDFSLFEAIDTLANGPLWARAASSADGRYIHIIATYQDTTVTINEIRRPVAYWKYDMNTSNFVIEKQLLPGYDTTRYNIGTPDEYSIDARDSVVSILIGGMANDLAIWTSTDNGENFEKYIIDSFLNGQFDGRNDVMFDTTFTNDGSINVSIDKNGISHVFFGITRVLNDDPTDSSYTFFPGVGGIFYWNTTLKDTASPRLFTDFSELIFEGEEINLLQGNFNTTPGVPNAASQGAARYYTGGAIGLPIAGFDDNNYIYCIFSAHVETATSGSQLVPLENFRDVFMKYSINGGQTWTGPLNLTPSTETNLNFSKEEVYATLPRDFSNNLPIIFMQDDDPGTMVINQKPEGFSTFKYSEYPLGDIFEGKVTRNPQAKPLVNIAETKVKTAKLFPNPAQDFVNISIEQQGVTYSIELVDLSGRTIKNVDKAFATYTLSTSDLNKGIYLVKIKTANEQYLSKLVVK